MKTNTIKTCLSAWLCQLGLAFAVSAAPVDPLAHSFQQPPAAARPWVYWFWLNGNLTAEGMTADLEAMQRAGIGGVLIMEVDQGSPVGPVAFMSDRWRELFRHMVSEAARLGIEVNMNNDAGWNGSGGPWVPLDKAMQVVVATETRVKGGSRLAGLLKQPAAKEGFYRDIAVLAYPTPAGSDNPTNKIQDLPSKAMAWGRMHPASLVVNAPAAVPAAAVVTRERIINLTESMDKKGVLVWDAPVSGGVHGEWTVLRVGHTFTGAKSHPAPATGAGPECDKLSPEGIETHYCGMIGKLVKDVGPLAGKVFAATHVDSWEVGAQNWTPKMRAEFERLRGYDLLPFLPVLMGQVVDSQDISERFLRDLRQTASDLLAVNYIGRLRQLAHADGLRLTMECYTTPANDTDIANHIDEPICEFWMPNGGNWPWTAKAMASAAHINGLPVVGAEAFTAGKSERWLDHPATMKALGDRMFCDGVSRMIFHRYAMQPWKEKRWPGMTMGPWGVHYERSNPWWEDSKAWHQYLHRCQFMLREGRFVADVLVLQSEEPMQRFTGLKVKGYDYDGISPQSFLKNVSVKEGKLVLPSGMSYRVLALPPGDTMSLRMLEKIATLVEAGAKVVGRPPSRAPGLSGYPQADERVRTLAARLWSGDRAITDQPADQTLGAMGITPDFESNPSLHYIHRTVGDKEVYFVSNPTAQAVESLCSFRIAGKSPEAWYAESGRIEPLRVFEEKDGRTRIPLHLDPSGSLFVVFQPVPSDPAKRIVSIRHAGNELSPLAVLDIADLAREKPPEEGGPALDLWGMNALRNGNFTVTTADGRNRETVVFGLPGPVGIAGPWQVSFPPGGGAPEQVTFDRLDDWRQRPEEGIKYYSGPATYRKVFSHPPLVGNQQTWLELGQVKVMAEVTLNDNVLGTLWKPPFRMDVTRALKPGENKLEVRVINLPVNRMIGDENLPEDSVRNPNGTLKVWPQWLQEGKPSPAGRIAFSSWRLWKKDEPLQPSGLLGPVTLQTVSPIVK